MNELSKVIINQQEITVKEYRGKRVVTFKEIDQCHGKQEGAARKRFNENKQHFVSGEDFFEISRSDVGDDFGHTYGFASKAPKGIIITESGYLMLVKSFTDDLAWQIQRQLVNTYFKVGQSESNEVAKIQASQERARAMLLNAQNRTFKTIMGAIKDKKLSSIAVEVFGLTAIEQLTGKQINYRPECETTYSASEIANAFGTNKNKVGKIANANNLKTDEYGITVLDKSPFSSKEVPSFRYNAKGKAKIGELLGKSKP